MVVVDEPDLGTQVRHHHLLVFRQYADSPSVSGLKRIQCLHPGFRAKDGKNIQQRVFASGHPPNY
jgi:hypothetical protein